MKMSPCSLPIAGYGTHVQNSRAGSIEGPLVLMGIPLASIIRKDTKKVLYPYRTSPSAPVRNQSPISDTGRSLEIHDPAALPAQTFRDLTQNKDLACRRLRAHSTWGSLTSVRSAMSIVLRCAMEMGRRCPRKSSTAREHMQIPFQITN